MRIISTGCVRPGRAVLSSQLDTRLGLPAGRVEALSGVRYRYFAEEGALQSDYAASAVRQALDRAALSIDDIDLLISASAISEQALPNTSSAVLRQLGVSGIACFDINSSCLSFMTALHVAASLLKTGAHRRIAIVSCDFASRGLDWSHPEASWIFGDGAAALIVDAQGEGGIEAYVQTTYPKGFDHCQIIGGGSRAASRPATAKDDLFQMDGKAVFKLASKVLPGVVEDVLEKAGVDYSQIDAFVPHQASKLALSHMTRRLELPEDRTVDIYRTHGNQVSASLPTALHHAFEAGWLDKGARVMLMGTAAGFSAAAMIMRVR